MVASISEVASCKKRKVGVMELFDMPCRATCATKLLFTCSKWKNKKNLLNVGEIISEATNLLDLSCVLEILTILYFVLNASFDCMDTHVYSQEISKKNYYYLYSLTHIGVGGCGDGDGGSGGVGGSGGGGFNGN